MISKVRISDPTKTPIKWLPKVKFLATPHDYEFTPGLNILWGKNGSGKSTLLRLIAKLFHAEQGRVSTITEHSIQELFGFGLGDSSCLEGVAVSHDGQGIIFYDPSDKTGLIGGGAGFDYDFFEAGVSSCMLRASSGETTMHNLGNAMVPLKTQMPLKPTYKVRKSNVNDLWQKRIQATERFFEADIELGKTTIIFDEPDRSLDIPAQKNMWDVFSRVTETKRAQMIVASHSAFACNIKNANYIETSPGYLGECRKAIKDLG